MQFNAVVQSNGSAGAFRHPTLGRTGLHVMYQEF